MLTLRNVIRRTEGVALAPAANTNWHCASSRAFTCTSLGQQFRSWNRRATDTDALRTNADPMRLRVSDPCIVASEKGSEPRHRNEFPLLWQHCPPVLRSSLEHATAWIRRIVQRLLFWLETLFFARCVTIVASCDFLQ